MKSNGLFRYINISLIIHAAVFGLSMFLPSPEPIPPATAVRVSRIAPTKTEKPEMRPRKSEKSPRESRRTPTKAAPDSPQTYMSQSPSVTTEEEGNFEEPSAESMVSGQEPLAVGSTASGQGPLGTAERPGVGRKTPGKPSAKGRTSPAKPAPPAREKPQPDPDFEHAKSVAEDYYRNDGVVFLDVDLFVLHGPHSNTGVPVPGTEICIDGDRLRAKEPLQFTDVKTDWSACVDYRIAEHREELLCPNHAHATKVLFDGYLSSPITYSVNTCLEYDSSHCYLKSPGTFSTMEICRVDFKYEGIWAAGTIFDYKCTKSENRVYRHPLEYTIRYMQDIDNVRHSGMMRRPRLLHQVTRPIPKCQ